jgi:hypothetical protein
MSMIRTARAARRPQPRSSAARRRMRWCLFDGSLDAWTARRVPGCQGGVLTVPPRDGKESVLVSKQSFGDVQLHLEFRSPNPPRKSSQDRGNSGIWFMQRYEVQIRRL